MLLLAILALGVLGLPDRQGGDPALATPRPPPTRRRWPARRRSSASSRRSTRCSAHRPHARSTSRSSWREMREYAHRNDGELDQADLNRDRRRRRAAWVVSEDELGEDAERRDREDVRGDRPARAHAARSARLARRPGRLRRAGAAAACPAAASRRSRTRSGSELASEDRQAAARLPRRRDHARPASSKSTGLPGVAERPPGARRRRRARGQRRRAGTCSATTWARSTSTSARAGDNVPERDGRGRPAARPARTSSASARSGARRGTTTTCTSTSATAARIGGGGVGFAGPLDDVRARGQARRLGQGDRATLVDPRRHLRGRPARYGGPPDLKIIALMCQMAKPLGPKIRLATFETAIVESGHPQPRLRRRRLARRVPAAVDRRRLGHAGADDGPADRDARMFLDAARQMSSQYPNLSAGELAARVQRPREDLRGQVRRGRGPGRHADRGVLQMSAPAPDRRCCCSPCSCAGCLGGDEDERPAAAAAPIDDGVSAEDRRGRRSAWPTPSRPRRRSTRSRDAALRAQLDAGAVALVDLDGRDRDPAAHDRVRQGRADRASSTWQRWDDRGAEGTGTMDGRRVRPRLRAGTLHLRAGDDPARRTPVACPAGRFFDRGGSRSPSDDPDADVRLVAGGAVLGVALRGRPPRRAGRPRCPHSGQGERATSSRHQRQIHGSSAAISSAVRRPHVERVRDGLDQLAGAPPRLPAGRRLDLAHLEAAERRVDDVAHPGDVAVARGDDEPRRPRRAAAAGTAARLAAEPVDGGLGERADGERAAGREATRRAGRRSAPGVESPVTLPSHVKTCSSASSSGSSEASTPVDGAYGAQAEASEASTVAASGGSAGLVAAASRWVSSIERDHRDARDRGGPDPLGRDRDHAARPPAARTTPPRPARRPARAPGGSRNASIRPSLSSSRSGRRPNTRTTGRSACGGHGRGLFHARRMVCSLSGTTSP